MCASRNKAIRRSMLRDVYLRLLRDCLPLQCVEKVASVGLVLSETPLALTCLPERSPLPKRLANANARVNFCQHCHLQLEAPLRHRLIRTTRHLSRLGECLPSRGASPLTSPLPGMTYQSCSSSVQRALHHRAWELQKSRRIIPPCEIPRACARRLNAALLLRGLELRWI